MTLEPTRRIPPIARLAPSSVRSGACGGRRPGGARREARSAGARLRRDRASDASGGDPTLAGVRARLERLARAWTLSPGVLGGMPRRAARRLGLGGGVVGVLLASGQPLGGVVVRQRRSRPSSGRTGASPEPLPGVRVDGAAERVLETALGTVVRFERDGVDHVVLGSVPRSVALAAARSLR